MPKLTLMSPTTRAELLQRTTDPAERAGLLMHDRDTHQPRTPGGTFAAGSAHGPRKIIIVPVLTLVFIGLSSWQSVFTTRLVRNWGAAESIKFTNANKSVTRKIKAVSVTGGCAQIELEPIQ